MKITVYEFITEALEVEVEDGLEGEALEAAIEAQRVNSGAPRTFIQCTGHDWDYAEDEPSALVESYQALPTRSYDENGERTE